MSYSFSIFVPVYVKLKSKKTRIEMGAGGLNENSRDTVKIQENKD